MSHSGTYTYNQIQTLQSNAHTLTLSRTIAFRIHTLCSQARQRGVSTLHHTLGRTHIHQRYIASTHQRGKHTHYLQNTYIRDTSCHILLHEENILTTYKTHTSEIYHAIYSSRRITSSHTQEHIHQRYYPYSLTRGTHTHYLHNRPIRDTSCHILLKKGSLRHTLANTYTRNTMHLLLHGDTANTFTRVFGKETYSHPREQHQTYAPPYTLTQREHRHTRETYTSSIQTIYTLTITTLA